MLPVFETDDVGCSLPIAIERSAHSSVSAAATSWQKRFALGLSSAVIHVVILAIAALVLSSRSGVGSRGGSGSGGFAVSFLRGTSDSVGGGFDNAVSKGSPDGTADASAHEATRIEPPDLATPSIDYAIADIAAVFNASDSDNSIQRLLTEPRQTEVSSEERATLIPSARERRSLSTARNTEAVASSSPPNGRANGSDGSQATESTGRRTGSGRTRGIGNGSGTGAGDQTQFFGIEVRAKRFVYVIDASDSMLQHRALELAREELWLSLQELTPPTKFQVVFFNLTQQSLTRNREKPQLLLASPANLRQAAQFLAEVQTDSGTDRLRALTYALKLEPEALFLLTDADAPVLTAPDLAKLRTLNRSRAAIHVVEFGTRSDLSDDNFLKAVARQNSGTHRYVDLTK